MIRTTTEEMEGYAMKAFELRKFLRDIPKDTDVFLSIDEKGNAFRSLEEDRIELIANWDADGNEGRALVLWP